MAGQNQRVKVTTAIPLSDRDRTKIELRLTRIFGNPALHYEFRVDPGIIAGITVQMEGQVFDGSVRSKLNVLERNLTIER